MKNHSSPAAARLLTLALVATLCGGAAPVSTAADLSVYTVQAEASANSSAFDGVVEAVRQTVLAAQVPAAVVQVDVKVGDRVRAGQVLIRLDARAADQTAAASDAQVLSARASLDLATREFERQKQLFQKNYISQAALDRAESEFKATQAQVNAQLAQAGVAKTQTGFHVLRAPYDGIVSEVPVALGDMAMPGRALVTVFDPAALRVTAAVAQTVASQMTVGQPLRIELPGMPEGKQWAAPVRVQTLPMVDAATHTAQIRADLPRGLDGVAPGQFARLWLPMPAARAGASARALSVPTSAVVRRAELTALYVLDGKGQPLLRQVRLGRVEGDRVEVLTGLSAGERVATDPQAAAKLR